MRCFVSSPIHLLWKVQWVAWEENRPFGRGHDIRSADPVGGPSATVDAFPPESAPHHSNWSGAGLPSGETKSVMPDQIQQNKSAPEKPNPWIVPWQKAYQRFLKIRGHPREISLGFALGLFVGMSPFMGLHTAIAVLLAALFKWNKISAALAVWISNPFSAPVIYGLTYIVGARVLAYENSYTLPQEFDLNALLDIIRSAPDLIGVLIVGGIVTGIPLGVAGYFGAYFAIYEYRKNLQPRLNIEKATNIARKIKNRRRRRKRRKKKKKRRR